jgi:hypothetical protein
VFRGPLLSSKLRALAIHLGLSVLIFAPYLYLITQVWFPGPLFATDGGWQGLRIMLLCDLVIGPLLTFLVYRPDKTRRALAIDFSFISLVQIAALVYGTHAVLTQRPVAVSLSEGVFQVVLPEDLKPQTIAPDGWNKFGDGKPYWVFRRAPKDADERGGVVIFAMAEGVGEHALHYLFEPLKASRDAARSQQIDRAKLIAEDPSLAAKFAAIEAGRSASELTWLRLAGRYADALIAFDTEMNIVGWIPQDLPSE